MASMSATELYLQAYETHCLPMVLLSYSLFGSTGDKATLPTRIITNITNATREISEGLEKTLCADARDEYFVILTKSIEPHANNWAQIRCELKKAKFSILHPAGYALAQRVMKVALDTISSDPTTVSVSKKAGDQAQHFADANPFSIETDLETIFPPGRFNTALKARIMEEQEGDGALTDTELCTRALDFFIGLSDSELREKIT